MSNKDIVEVIFKILVIIELAILMLIAGKLSTLYKEKNDLKEKVKQLEINYKIYELNLNELQENREAHFE